MPSTTAASNVTAIANRLHPPDWVLDTAGVVAAVAPIASMLGYGGLGNKVSAAVDIGLYAAAATLISLAAWRGFALPSTAILWPALAFGSLVIFQYAFRLTAYRGATLTALLGLAACGAEFYLGWVGFRGAARLRRLRWWLFFVTGGLSIEAILQFFTANKNIYWVHPVAGPWPMGPFVYNNHYAGCMDLLIPVAVLAIFAPGRPDEELWLTFARRSLFPLLAFISVILSLSRGGLLVLFFETALGFWVFWPEIRKNSARLRLWLSVGAFALGGLLLAPWEPLLSRFDNPGQDVDLAQRLKFTESCLQIFRDHPFLGTGFGTFSTVYPRYALFDNGLRLLYAHNDYAQLLAETGLLGGATAVVFGFYLWRAYRRTSAAAAPMRRFQLSLYLAMAGIMVHSIFDFEFHAPSNALLFFLFAAAAVQRPGSGSPARRALVQARRNLTSWN